jgi:hypothetical protein
MWFQHDGAPPHYGRQVHHWLPENYFGRWNGRGREPPVFWPARSPDFSPLDFLFISTHLWGYLKINGCASTVDTGEEARRRIRQFASEMKNTGVIFERSRVYFHADLSCVSVNTKAVSRTFLEKVKSKEIISY